MPRKKKWENKETAVVGIRVPKDIKDEIKAPIREFADYYIETKHTLKDLLNKNDNDSKPDSQANSS